ncbi:MAG: MBOAT family O-acyltransferase, partial [Myxococcota bacterium]
RCQYRPNTAHWDWRFLALIVLSTLVDYTVGPLIHRESCQRKRTLWLCVSLTVNLGILGYFKYYNFFADSLIVLAQSAGLELSRTTLAITLPVGISFYTFQTLSYSLDIYRRQLEPTDSLAKFAAFVAFFPQLVAGPIVRAREFLHQLDRPRVFSFTDFEGGLTRFLFGFFKKVFIADTLGIYVVDPVFADPAAYTTATLWLAMLAYAVQIYADFSGYSSMAIGSAQMLGFRIPENFRFPYLATNPSDFWRRWHMTMSRFFRDYVYIALGGNRGSFARTQRNLAATTLVSGLWHGASWTFVVWGALHGLYLTINQQLRRLWPQRPSLPAARIGSLLIGWLITQLAVCLAWVLFRAGDFATAWDYLTGMFTSSATAHATIDGSVMIWLA